MRFNPFSFKRNRRRTDENAQPATTPAAPAPATPLHTDKALVYAIFAPKGGVGKTTLSVNLAVALSERGRFRVLLIDADLQFGGVASALDLAEPRPGSTLSAYLAEGDWSLIQPGLVTFGEAGRTLQVLPAPFNPWDAERIPQGAVRTLVETARPHFDRIIVDTHSSYDSATLEILGLADSILLVMTPETSVVRNTRGFLTLAEPLGLLPKINLVVNRFKDGLPIEQIQSRLNLPVRGTVHGAGPLVVEATNVGRPFVLAKPRAAVSLDIRALADQVAAGQLRPGQSQEPVIEIAPEIRDLPLSALSPNPEHLRRQT